MDHKKKIEDVMNSLDGIERTQPDHFMYSRILQRIEGDKSGYPTTRLVWLAAASFAILIMLNLIVIRNTISDKKMSSTQSQSQGYNLVNINSINYN